MAPKRKTTIFRRAPRAPQEQIERSNITKALQDCLAVEVLRHERDRDAEPVMFFGVFDGHGEHGGTVAALAAEQLPMFIREHHTQVLHLPNVDRWHKADDPGTALLSGFASTQQFLLQQPGLDCSLSGCTAVVAMLVSDTLVVANAGDSRCLAGRFEANTELVAYELSNDHTPGLLHEANRILASGGRIAPLEFAGRNVGPPRVWERNSDQPGLCITRSLGDTQAKRLGVTHVPELATFKLTAGDRYLALVSDGVTEFMGSQEIMETIHKLASAGTMPHEVARRLVREARNRWREIGDEGVVDDCTAVVAYLVCEDEGEEEEATRHNKRKKKKTASIRARIMGIKTPRYSGTDELGAAAGGGGGGGEGGSAGEGAGNGERPSEVARQQGRGRMWSLQRASALWTTVRSVLVPIKREEIPKEQEVDV
ncbi:hypothetical protein VOLCADRAFT_96929 [Volvox carteri f. nagariensis]|uniref:protein-serine/threonine phosphatase n=1 Tax=Volvox carteri f. nagariensis TaxID=3068 RepID=D8UBC9_VOLCA|nr:uncharacterized protein VOLCADRAFT_96929 [Volvox carteri f. nagariensis]EFJ42980.1 hypothetical protein VOLCADRAFT_96929 [Volvox carteri f. nagariensis]|eukprot:XP_002956020.1 hypothetical protein VOLCADRAFT_96929 [Volvox carteri f. nagariensis]